MVFAVIYAENADVVGTYDSLEDAMSALEGFVAAEPSLQDEIGVRPYEDGHPVGDWQPASDVLVGRIVQPHLA